MIHLKKEGKLRRNISLLEGITYVIAYVIGTGIFLKPAIVLANTGSSATAIIIWVLGGLITMCGALTISEIAAYIPKVGGLYTYLIELYGNTIGFLFGWIEIIVGGPGGIAAVAIAFATFATYFIPMSDTGVKYFAVFSLLIIVILQIVSTKLSMQIQVAATIAKLLPIAAIVIFGLVKGNVPQYINFSAIGGFKAGGTGIALLGVLWAYDGWVATCNLGEELVHAEKNLPRAIILGVIFVIGVYVLFNIVIFKTLPTSSIVASKSVGIDVSQKLFGTAGTTLVALGMLVSSLAALNAQVVGGARTAFAMAQRKQIFKYKVLSHVNPKFDTPVNSILFQSILAVIFIILGTFNTITNLVIFVIWIFFTLGIFGIFILRKRYPRKKKLYRVPLYPLIPILGGLGGCYLIFVTVRDSLEGSVLGIVLTLVGLPMYFYCKNTYSHGDSGNSRA